MKRLLFAACLLLVACRKEPPAPAPTASVVIGPPSPAPRVPIWQEPTTMPESKPPPKRHLPVLHSAEEVRKHVGEIVTIEGVVTNTKAASLLGVLVPELDASNRDTRNHRYRMTGLLTEYTERWPEGGGAVQGFGDGTKHLLLQPFEDGGSITMLPIP